MRVGILLLAGICVGCAAKPQAVVTASNYEPRYAEAAAAALVFDPPVAAGEAPIELSRDSRAPAAVVGFDGPITTFFWIHTDDWQQSDWGGSSNGVGDHYERRAVVDKSGVTYR